MTERPSTLNQCIETKQTDEGQFWDSSESLAVCVQSLAAQMTLAVELVGLQ
jgi:hypothetical protein